ncbi:MAG: hypothetical protein EOP51_06220 [Sphingobacteriales bacterium]|nr:MAG: hypothetical protein EOP51_06220 [Sphingobacteriales bacterium]
MRIVAPYKQLNKLIEKETIESTFSWGLRMAISAIVPVLWGLATNRLAEATWITLTAECICWMELKGSFGQGARVLFAGILLTSIFGFLGTVTANSFLLSIICMFGVGFVAVQFKNLGNRGSGLAICVYVLYILCNAYPVKDLAGVWHRSALIAIGGTWCMAVGVFITLLMPAREPYRRTIALIWQSISQLTATVAKGWDGNGTRSSLRDIYLKEKQVRTSIDDSFHFYEAMAHQANKNDKEEYQLAQFRKATALIATHITAISEELENIHIRDIESSLQQKIYAIMRAMQQMADRMAVYVVTLQPEEELLLTSRIDKLNKVSALLKEYQLPDAASSIAIKRIIQLTERTVKLVESSMSRLQEMGDDKAVFRSYSLIKTLFVLHPRHLVRNLKILLDPDTFTMRYALRASVAATVALFIDKWFHIDHGYWIPFTTLTIMQPYFGATFQKAIDRIIGTVAGGVAGGLTVRLPVGIYVKEAMLFLCFVFMIYFIRKRYALATFFITFSLVLLFDVERELDQALIFIRMGSTLGGAFLAILSGFVLLPHWDTKWLPFHIGNTISSNYNYFVKTFFEEGPLVNWTRYKRIAESKNSNAFDSFNRYMQEPSLKKKPYSIYYHIITHNVRLTRELNNIYLEQENRSEKPNQPADDSRDKILECLNWFNKNLVLSREITNSTPPELVATPAEYKQPFTLTTHQNMYIDRLIIELRSMHQDLLRLNDKVHAA